MVQEAVPPGRERLLRCTHCGRLVAETRHTRETWRVDYYLLHTGDVEPTAVARDGETEVVTYLKLVRAVDIVTCVDCYRDPAVREEREERFHAVAG